MGNFYRFEWSPCTAIFLGKDQRQRTCDDERVTGADRLYPVENISAADAFTVGAVAAEDELDAAAAGFGFLKSRSDDLGCGGGGFTTGTVEAVT